MGCEESVEVHRHYEEERVEEYVEEVVEVVEVIEEVHHDVFVYEGPPIEFNETPGLSFAQVADDCAARGGRLPDAAELQDYLRGRNYEPVYHRDCWVAVNGPDGDDWIQIGNNHTVGQSHVETHGYPQWGHDGGQEWSAIAIVF